jgi:phosphohistidine phosphatase
MLATKQLFVLRHAKSSWDNPGLEDHERPLAPRGRRSVEMMAEHIRSHDIRPGQVLCSTSRRTRETLEGVAPGGERLIEPELYAASSRELIERLRRVPEEIDSVMVIGHNPAMQTLVLRLADGCDRTLGQDEDGDGSYLTEVQSKFPTGALATLTFQCAWQELGPQQARLVGFVRPKAIVLKQPI